MRFGVMIAAAAALLCAGQAEAARWVTYQVVANGTYTTYSSLSGNPPFTNTGDLLYTFTIDVDAPTGTFTGASYSATASTNGLTYTYSYRDVYSAVSSATITALFSNPGGGFPTTISNIAATGTLSAIDASKGGYLQINGTITGLRVVGPAAGFIFPSAAAVPEPTSWAMMILGIGLLGAITRRRRQQTLRSTA